MKISSYSHYVQARTLYTLALRNLATPKPAADSKGGPGSDATWMSEFYFIKKIYKTI